MSMQSPAPADTPMSAINTTPLIDVLLVLLIMLVITIPVATNQMEFDLPSGWPHGPVYPTVNRLSVSGDEAITWNGTPVTQQQLAANLSATAAMRPEPELQFHPEADASYDLSARLLHLIKQSHVTRFGFVGNEQFAEFGKPQRVTVAGRAR